MAYLPAQGMVMSAEYPFESHFAQVLGSKMHYVDVGDASESGLTFLCLHGNPTSSYLWRNVIPHLQAKGRVVAPDLIGMGKSDKPDIDYRFVDHSRYLDAFIESLALKDVVLVLHDWGSALGFYYAWRNEGNVRGIAFMEAVTAPAGWKDFPGPAKIIFRLFRNSVTGPWMIQRRNFFVRRLLPMMVKRKLNREEKLAYAAPYPDYASRKPLYVWPNEIPIEGSPRDTHDIISGYRQWLEKTPLPKLLLWSKPGALIPPARVKELAGILPNLQTEYVGKGLHYIQEDHPDEIGEAVAQWSAGL